MLGESLMEGHWSATSVSHDVAPGPTSGMPNFADGTRAATARASLSHSSKYVLADQVFGSRRWRLKRSGSFPIWKYCRRSPSVSATKAASSAARAGVFVPIPMPYRQGQPVGWGEHVGG